MVKMIPSWTDKYDIEVDERGIWDKKRNELLVVNRSLYERILKDGTFEEKKLLKDNDAVNEPEDNDDNEDSVVNEPEKVVETTEDTEEQLEGEGDGTEDTETDEVQETEEQDQTETVEEKIEEVLEENVTKAEVEEIKEIVKEELEEEAKVKTYLESLTDDEYDVVAEKTGLSSQLVKRLASGSSKLNEERVDLIKKVM